MFYHDHAWGITRLNVYAGEAAGYLITDDTEQTLIGAGWHHPQACRRHPARHPGPDLRAADADPARPAGPDLGHHPLGRHGNFWYHHVYMPAQNPGDPGGMSAYGRWMYGPWFWPPAGDAIRADRQPVLQHGPGGSDNSRHCR